MKKEHLLKIGKQYSGYGKYLGIVKVHNSDGNEFKEHRFQTEKYSQGASIINSLKTTNKEAIEKIWNLKTNSEAEM